MNAHDQTALLGTPSRRRASPLEAGAGAQRRAATAMRRDPVPDLREEFGSRRSVSRHAAQLDAFEDEDAGAVRASGVRVPGSRVPGTRVPGVRLKVRWQIPRTVVGRVVVCLLGLTGLGAVTYSLYRARVAVLHDARLIIPSSQAVEITGNNHLTRAQLLSVFGEDVDRNLMTVPLEDRRAELEALPWVEHATVMRLLPNHMRVAIKERTPVAFVRQGSQIGLVDAHGVLLDLSPELEADHAYSFPVLSGVSATDPVSVRAARMKLYLRFTDDLDAGMEQISRKLSEVDLTDPEDIKVLVPDHGTDVLVHLGEKDFLRRYDRYVQNLPEWKSKYPKLASVDMRYEHDVVLEMAAGSTVPIAEASAEDTAANSPVLKKPVSKKLPVKLASKPKPKTEAQVRKVPVRPAPPATGHLQESFDVKPAARPAKAGPQ